MMHNKKLLTIFAISSFIFFGFTNSADSFDHTLSFILALYTAVLVFWKKWIGSSTLRFLAIVPIMIVFVLSSWHNSTDLRKYLQQEPQPETYRTDMDDFLRTYYLMKDGRDYYTAFKKAVEENPFKKHVSQNVWSWRLPTIFYVWKIVPTANGIGIYLLFLFFSMTALFVSMNICYELLPDTYKQYSLLSTYLLYPYLHFAARDKTMLQTEWWGIFVLLIGILFLLKSKSLYAGLIFTLAISIRELLILPISLLIVAWFFVNKKSTTWLIAPLFLAFVVIMFHMEAVIQKVGFNPQFIAPRLLGSKQMLLSTFAFGSWEYAAYFMRPFLFFYAISIVVLLKYTSKRWLVFLPFIVFPVSFLFLGSSVYNDYWGIFYMPFIIISTPLVLSKLW